eukprot:108136_1
MTSPLEQITVKDKLGERVKTAQKRLKEKLPVLQRQYNEMQLKLPHAITYFKNVIKEAFKNRLPYPDETLVMYWLSNKVECEQLIMNTCIMILTPPIDREEFKWFESYVISSLLWFQRSPTNTKYLYHNLMDIIKNFAIDVTEQFNTILKETQQSAKWDMLHAIKNEEHVLRQDHEEVGLLLQVQDMNNPKKYCFTEDDIRDNSSLIDFINLYGCTAQLINISRLLDEEYHSLLAEELKGMEYKQGPPKTMDRCKAKIENDYLHSLFPQCSKLLDIVRCSIVFDTVGELVIGYEKMMAFINSSEQFQVARIKNGFSDLNNDEGYRDVKLNIIFKSAVFKGVNMICEIQMILSGYLIVKKKSHKLYNIERRCPYFDLVTGNNLPFYSLRCAITHFDMTPKHYLDVSEVINKDNRDNKGTFYAYMSTENKDGKARSSFQIYPFEDGYTLKSDNGYYLGIDKKYERDTRTWRDTDKSVYVFRSKVVSDAFVFEMKPSNTENAVLLRIIKPNEFKGFYIGAHGTVYTDKRSSNSTYLMAIGRAYDGTPFIIEEMTQKEGDTKEEEEEVEEKTEKGLNQGEKEYFEMMKNCEFDFGMPQVVVQDIVHKKMGQTHRFMSDAGSGAALDINFYRFHDESEGDSKSDDKEWKEIGCHALQHKQWCQIPLVNGKEVQVAKPMRYELMWSNEGSSKSKRYALFKPVPPDGFVALCDVPRFGTNLPNDTAFEFDGMYCVEEKYAVRSTFTKKIWWDKGTGARQDGSVWQIEGGLWMTSKDYQPPDVPCYRLK